MSQIPVRLCWYIVLYKSLQIQGNFTQHPGQYPEREISNLVNVEMIDLYFRVSKTLDLSFITFLTLAESIFKRTGL